RRGAKASHPSAAGTVGQSTQALGSPGTQSHGQSRDGRGKELVESAHLCPALGPRVDERVTFQHATDPVGLAGKDPGLNTAAASRRRSWSATRLWRFEERGDRSRGWYLEAVEA